MNRTKLAVLTAGLALGVACTGFVAPALATEATATPSAQEATAAQQAQDASYLYSQLDDGTLCLTAYTGSDAEVYVPAELDGQQVSRIGESCFAGNVAVKKVHVPEGITALGDYAFECCPYLQKVYLPDGLLAIGDGAFSGCVDLKLVDIQEGLTSIGRGSFLYCNNLASIYLPSTLEEMGEFAFAYCTSLSQVTFAGDSCTVLPDRAFFHCESLITIKLSQSLESVGKRAFAYCDHLERIWLPDSVKTVGAYAFEQCARLSNANFPADVLQDGTFANCNALEYISLSDNLTAIGSQVFTCTGITQLSIPASVTSIAPDAFHLAPIEELDLEEGAQEWVLEDLNHDPDEQENEGTDQEADGQEDAAQESAADEAAQETTPDEAVPTLDEVLEAALADYPDCIYFGPNGFDDFAQMYLEANEGKAPLDQAHNIYVTLYKGEVVPHYFGFTSVQNHDPEMVEKAQIAFGDDYESMYLMFVHGLTTELTYFHMPCDTVLFSGLYDSQLMAAAGTDVVPTDEQLVASIGSTFSDPISISTTTDPFVAVNFGDTMFFILASAEKVDALGAVCMDAYMHTNEAEVLMNAGATYRVLGYGMLQMTQTDEWSGAETVIYEKYLLVELL